MDHMVRRNEVLQKRDAKAKPHLEQYAPIWLINEEVMLEEEAVQFDVVFRNVKLGWIQRRYRYDAFNDVLYHKGQHIVADEDEIIDITEQEPYIRGVASDVANAYGG